MLRWFNSIYKPPTLPHYDMIITRLIMFQLILLTAIFVSIPIKGKPPILKILIIRLTTTFYFVVHSQASPSCLAPPLSSQGDNEPLHLNREWRNLCSNDPAAGVVISTMECSIANPISENCHLWGSDGSQKQMLFIYLLRITSETLTLHYFNDSNSSQMNSSRYQLCAANNNLEIIEMDN